MRDKTKATFGGVGNDGPLRRTFRRGQNRAYHAGDDTSRAGLGRGTLAEEQRRRGSTLKHREVGESRASIEQQEGSKCRIVGHQKDDRSSCSFPIVPKNASRHGFEIRGTLHRHIPFIW